jgi:hypothetical protein
MESDSSLHPVPAGLTPSPLVDGRTKDDLLNSDMLFYGGWLLLERSALNS